MTKQITYEMPLVLDLGKAIPEVGELEKSVNGHLSTMGVDTGLSIVLPLSSLTFESSRPLTNEELKVVHEMAKKTVAETMTHPVTVGEPRCQSRKSSKKSR